jgi:hypothetical protein
MPLLLWRYWGWALCFFDHIDVPSQFTNWQRAFPSVQLHPASSGSDLDTDQVSGAMIEAMHP